MKALISPAFHRSPTEPDHHPTPAYVRVILGEGEDECWVGYYLSDQEAGPRRAVVDVMRGFAETLMEAHPNQASRREYEEEGDCVPAAEVSFGELARSGLRWNGKRVAVTGYHASRSLYDSASNRTEPIEIMWESSFSKQTDILNAMEGHEGLVCIEGVYDSNPEGRRVLKRITRMVPFVGRTESLDK